MWYHRYVHEDLVIEFKNNAWDGVEHIIIDGIPYSSKTSLMGTTHEFTIDGKLYTYIVRVSPWSLMEVTLTLYIDKVLIFKDTITYDYSFHKGSFSFSSHTYKGKKKMQLYDIEEAIACFHEALEIKPNDWDAHFYLACCYSLLEDVEHGLKHLQAYIRNNPKKIDRVRQEEHLAFLRMQDGYEG